jgi:hypothetical protein
MQRILIVGATSAIAEATARRWAARGDALFLAGRRAARLDMIAADLRVRGASAVVCAVFDACDLSSHEAMLQAAETALGGLDIVLIAHGSLPDQQACEASVELTLAAMQTNALSVIALATLIGQRFEAQGQGCLAVIGSVAGDRGRQSNYVYGAAKGMVGLFLQGMRNRLAKKGIQVLTVKPGFVDTPMTTAFPKGALWVKPDVIARGIVRAVDGKRDEVYLPGFWRPIMAVIRHIPESVFKRLSL